MNVIGVLCMARPVIDLNMTFTGLITGGYDLGYRVMVAYVWYFDEEVEGIVVVVVMSPVM